MLLFFYYEGLYWSGSVQVKQTAAGCEQFVHRTEGAAVSGSPSDIFIFAGQVLLLKHASFFFIFFFNENKQNSFVCNEQM